MFPLIWPAAQPLFCCRFSFYSLLLLFLFVLLHLLLLRLHGVDKLLLKYLLIECNVRGVDAARLTLYVCMCALYACQELFEKSGEFSNNIINKCQEKPLLDIAI